jgi:hypothetical protein
MLALSPLFMTIETKPVTMCIMMAHVSLICLMYQTCLVLIDRLLSDLLKMAVNKLLYRAKWCVVLNFVIFNQQKFATKLSMQFG